MSASALHSRALMGDAGTFLLLNQESQQSQERGEPTHNPPPPSLWFNKHLGSIYLVRKAGEWPKQIKYTSLPWGVYKNSPSSFQVVCKLPSLGSVLETTPVHSMILKSLGHRQPIHLGRHSTCHIFLFDFMKKRIDKVSPVLPSIDKMSQYCWITNARMQSLIANKPMQIWRTSEFALNVTSLQLLTVRSNHGHCLLKWCQQTSACSICGDLRVLP